MIAPQQMTVTLASAEDIARFGGSTVTLSLSPTDVTTTEEINTYLPGYRPFGSWRADEVVPPAPLVDIEFGLFRTFGSNNVFRRVNPKTSRTAPVGEIDPETSVANYQALMYGLGSFIPASLPGQSKYDMQRAAARVIADKLTLDREVRVWTFLTTVGNWATNQVKTLGAGFNWNGGVNALPIVDLQTMCRASFQEVTDIYMSKEAAQNFINNDSVRDYLRLMNGDQPSAGQIANGAMPQGTAPGATEINIPGLPPIHVSGAKVLNETTLALDEIIGRANVVGICKPPISSVEFDTIQTARTFRVKGPSGTGYTSREYIVNSRGVDGGTMLVAGFTEDLRMVANNAGFLLRSVLS